MRKIDFTISRIVPCCFLLLLFILTLSYGAEAPSLYKTYELPFQPQRWYYSPFNDGKIWLADVNGTAQEFDPASGKCSSLTPLLGDFATGLADMVFTDAYNPHLIWISNFHKGLLAYHQPSLKAVKYQNGKYFNRAAMMDILPAREIVWIATSNGLYRLRRADWKIEALAQTRGIWVSNMRMAGPDEILFSGGTRSPDDPLRYRYRIAANRLEKLSSQARPDPVKEILATVKAGTRLDAKMINDIWDDDDLVWFVDSLGLGRIEKNSGRVAYLDLGGSWNRWPRALLPGKSVLWMLRGKQLLAVDRNPPAALITDGASMKARQQKIFAMESAIRDEKNVIVLFQKMVPLLNLIDRYRQGSSERERLFHDVMIAMHEHGRENMPVLKEYLLNKAADPAFKPYVLFGLFCAHSLAGDPGQALRYYRQLAEQYPDNEIFRQITAEDIGTLEQGEADLQRIKTGRIAPDQHLWQLGQAYAAMMRVTWNSVEMGYDMTLPYSYFSRLVERHPRSKYADNAWWLLNVDKHIWDGDCDMYTLNTMIPIYQDFIRSYPGSELVPMAMYRQALVILEAMVTIDSNQNPQPDDPAPEQRLTYLLQAKKLCVQALQAGWNEKNNGGYDKLAKTQAKIEAYLQKYSGKPAK